MSSQTDKKLNPSTLIMRNGNRHWSAVYAAMSQEERDEHNRLRTKRRVETLAMKRRQKTVRDYFDQLILANPAAFLSVLNNITVVQMQKALEGDTAAYNAVVNTVMAKPTERKEITQTTDLSVDGLAEVSDEQLTFLLNQNIDEEDSND